MPDLRILKLQAQRQLKQSLALANQFFNKEFTIPVMNFELRGQKAGVAYLQQNEIRLNPVLLVENGATFIQQVVPHELAHLLVYQQFGRVQPHGKEWKMMMEQVLGVPAHIYHKFSTMSVAKQFSYQCDCQTHLLSVRRHNAIQRNQHNYICRNCSQLLRFLPT
ncbi:SprT family zinc-dependent metalloprotease [Haemophilus parahaemolyticus]